MFATRESLFHKKHRYYIYISSIFFFIKLHTTFLIELKRSWLGYSRNFSKIKYNISITTTILFFYYTLIPKLSCLGRITRVKPRATASYHINTNERTGRATDTAIRHTRAPTPQLLFQLTWRGEIKYLPTPCNRIHTTNHGVYLENLIIIYFVRWSCPGPASVNLRFWSQLRYDVKKLWAPPSPSLIGSIFTINLLLSSIPSIWSIFDNRCGYHAVLIHTWSMVELAGCNRSIPCPVQSFWF